MRVLLVRHGESEKCIDRLGTNLASEESPLTARGVFQSEIAGYTIM